MEDLHDEVVVIPTGGAIAPIPDTAAFGVSLKRSYSQIRKDRADDLTRKTYIKYKRTIEDLDEELYSLQMGQENMLDLAPNHTQSLVVAGDFDAADYMKTDLDLSWKIRNKKIQANIARERCNYLFGTDYPLLEVKY